MKVALIVVGVVGVVKALPSVGVEEGFVDEFVDDGEYEDVGDHDIVDEEIYDDVEPVDDFCEEDCGEVLDEEWEDEECPEDCELVDDESVDDIVGDECEFMAVDDITTCLDPSLTTPDVCVPIVETVEEIMIEDCEAEIVVETVINTIEQPCAHTVTETAYHTVEVLADHTVTVDEMVPEGTTTVCETETIQPTMTEYHFEYAPTVVHPVEYETVTITQSPEPIIETEYVDETVEITATVTVTETTEVVVTPTETNTIHEGFETYIEIKKEILEPVVEEVWKTIYVPVGCVLDVGPTCDAEVDPVDHVDVYEKVGYGFVEDGEVDPVVSVDVYEENGYGFVEDDVAPYETVDDYVHDPLQANGYGSVQDTEDYTVADEYVDDEYLQDEEYLVEDPVEFSDY